jgi:hypothetical protein
MRNLGEDALPAIKDLQKATLDQTLNVVTLAAETLYLLGDIPNARNAYIRVLNSNDMMTRVLVLNSIDFVGEQSSDIARACAEIVKRYGELGTTIDRTLYDVRSIRSLFQKWELDPENYGIEFPW